MKKILSAMLALVMVFVLMPSGAKVVKGHALEIDETQLYVGDIVEFEVDFSYIAYAYYSFTKNGAIIEKREFFDEDETIKIEIKEEHIDCLLSLYKAIYKPGEWPPGVSGGSSSVEYTKAILPSLTPTIAPTEAPTAMSTIIPTIVPTTIPVAKIEDFKDVPKHHWGYEDAKWAIESGLMNGVYSDTFEPDGTLTRGMLVTILGRYEGVDVESYKAKKSFTDVASGEWYHPYVEWAKEKDIVTGIEPTYFAPNAKISRQDLATILLRYMKYKGYDTNKSGGTFVDEAQIASYAKEAVKVLSGYEIINGMGANDFQPTGEATRAQVAKMFRVFDKNITNK
ncbi:MAG: S-layer homology domain-containing protein [Oscillospiraceae bacterium]|nr:S-layer homology domain-containing protein [Oscillospiraceae bacterium]